LFAKNWALAVRKEVAVRRELSVRSDLQVKEEPVAMEERWAELKPKAMARAARSLVEQAVLAGLALPERPAVKVARAEFLVLWRAWRSLQIARR
jgi:hypothetical protein